MKKKPQTIKFEHGQAEFVADRLRQVLAQESVVDEQISLALYHAVAEIRLPNTEQLLHGGDELLYQQDQFLVDVEHLAQAAEHLIMITDTHSDLVDQYSVITEAQTIVHAKLALAQMISHDAALQQQSKISKSVVRIAAKLTERSFSGNASGDEGLYFSEAAARHQLTAIISQYSSQATRLAHHAVDVMPAELNSAASIDVNTIDTITALADRLIKATHQATESQIKAMLTNLDQSLESETIANAIAADKPHRQETIDSSILWGKSQLLSDSKSPISSPVDPRRLTFGSGSSSRSDSSETSLTSSGSRFGTLRSSRPSSPKSKKIKRGSVSRVLKQAAFALRKMSSRELQTLKKRSSSLKGEVRSAIATIDQVLGDLKSTLNQLVDQTQSDSDRLQVLRAITSILQTKLDTLDYQYINPKFVYSNFDQLTFLIPSLEKSLEENCQTLLQHESVADPVMTKALKNNDYALLSHQLELLKQTVDASDDHSAHLIGELSDLLAQQQAVVEHQQVYAVVANWVAQLDQEIPFSGNFRQSLQQQHEISNVQFRAESDCFKHLKADLSHNSPSYTALNQFKSALTALRSLSPDNEPVKEETLNQYQAARELLLDLEPSSVAYLDAVANTLVTAERIAQLEQTQNQFITQQLPAGKLLSGNLNPTMTLHERTVLPRLIQKALSLQDQTLTSGQNSPFFEYTNQQYPEKVLENATSMAENIRNTAVRDGLDKIWNNGDKLITKLLDSAFSVAKKPSEVPAAMVQYLESMGYSRPEDASSKATSDTFLAKAKANVAQVTAAYEAAEDTTSLYVEYIQVTNQLAAVTQEMAELEQEASVMGNAKQLGEYDRSKLLGVVEKIVAEDDVVSRREELIGTLIGRANMNFSKKISNAYVKILNSEWMNHDNNFDNLIKHGNVQEMYILEKSSEIPIEFRDLLNNYFNMFDPAHIIRDLIDYNQAEKTRLAESLASESITAVNQNAKRSLKQLSSHSAVLEKKLVKELGAVGKVGTMPLSEQETGSEAAIWQDFPEVSYFTALRDAIKFNDVKTLADIQQLFSPDHRLTSAITAHLNRLQPSAKQLDKFETKWEWEQTKTRLKTTKAASERLAHKQAIELTMQTLSSNINVLEGRQQNLYQAIRQINSGSSEQVVSDGVLPSSTDPLLLSEKVEAQKQSQQLQIQLKQAEDSLDYAKLDTDIPLATILESVEQRLNDSEKVKPIAGGDSETLKKGTLVAIKQHWYDTRYEQLPKLTIEDIDLTQGAAGIVGDYVKNSFKAGVMQVGTDVNPITHSVVQQYLFARVEEIHAQVAEVRSRVPRLEVTQQHAQVKAATSTGSYAMITQLTGGVNADRAPEPKAAQSPDVQRQAKTSSNPTSTSEPELDKQKQQQSSKFKGGPK